MEDSALEAGDHHLENGGIDRPYEFDSDRMAFDPADARLDRIISIELDPNRLIQSGPFDEFELAAFRRQIECADLVMMLAASAQLHLRRQRNARALAMPWTSVRIFLFHAADTPLRELRVDYRRYAMPDYYTCVRNGVKSVEVS